MITFVLMLPLFLQILIWLQQHSEFIVIPEPRRIQGREAEGGWTVAATVAVSIGMMIYSRYLMKKRLKNLRSDEKATPLTLRGSRTDYLVGIDLLQPVFGWAGNRQTRDEKKGAGKKGGLLGGLSPKTKIFHEDGWHVLCPGVGARLLAIKKGGKNTFTGPITSTTHPSGTVIDLGREGMFAIYWGEESQPVNSFLGDAGRVGVSSRWPGVCYIQWIQKRLSESPIWDVLEYEFDVPPDTDVCESIGLTGNGYIPPTVIATGDSFDIIAATNGVVGVGKFTVRGDRTTVFKPSQAFALAGNAHPDGNLVAYNVVVYQFLVSAAGDPDPDLGIPGQPAVYETRTDIFTASTLSGADATGTVSSYMVSNDDGYNPAHILAHMLFAEAPRGLGRNPALYDLPSFVEFADLADGEGLRCVKKAEEGASMESLIQGLLIDCGVLMPVDPITGLLTLKPIRETVVDPDDLPHITDDMLTGAKARPSRRMAGWQMDEAVINYKDRQQGYRDNPFLFGNDGIISWGGMANTRTLELTSTNLVGTAQVFSKRRAYEDLSPNTHFEIEAKNGVRLLMPGDLVRISDWEALVRIATIKPDEKSDSTKMNCFADNYGATPMQAEIDPFPGDDPEAEPTPDLIINLVEVPEVLLGKEKPTTIVSRVRAHAQIRGATIYSSELGSTYEAEDNDTNSAAGGFLLDAVPLSGLYYVEDGPRFQVAGPDVGNVLDLSSNENSFLRGDQLMAMGREIFYVRNITALGGGVYQTHGMMRARYDTRPEQHDVGRGLTIFPPDAVFALQKSYQVPDGTMFIKTTPFTSGVIAPSETSPVQIIFNGKGIRPVAPTQPMLDWIEAGYHTGDDLTFVWDYFCPRTPAVGAGNFPAGNVLDPVPPEGDFLIRFYDDMGVFVSEYLADGVVSPSFDYSNAQLVTDFGGEPTSFKVRVFQLRDGYRSFPSPFLTVEKIP